MPISGDISTTVVLISGIIGKTVMWIAIATVIGYRNDRSMIFSKAEAIRTTVVPISGVIRTTVVPISGVISPTVVRIANATGIGYRHDGSIRFSNKLTHALNY